MFEELEILPILFGLLIFFINSLRAKHIREVVLLNIWLGFQELLLLDREEPSLTNMLCVHEPLRKFMETGRGLDLSEVN